MINVKKIFLISFLLVQAGCSSFNSKNNPINTIRFPANDTKIVALVGFERNRENIQSEELVGRAILSLQSHFKYCYERELNSNPGLKADFFIYFGVTQKGIIQHITSDTVAAIGNPANLSECISAAISKARLPALNQYLTFRASLGFQAQ